MLINLRTTVESIAAEETQEIEELVSDLLRASSQGLHLVVIDRKICEWAKGNLSLNNRELAQLDRIRELYTQRGSLPAIAGCSLEVVTGDAQLVEHEPHKYQIGHRPFLAGNYLEASRLLVEHIENDGDMLDVVLNETRRKHPVKSYNFQRLHGGGADIAACLRIEVPNQHVVVCVVDSDKIAPSGPSSATKRNLDREAQRQTFVGMACETPCKEAENYIPLSILRDHRQRICPEYPCFENLTNLVDNQTVNGRSDCFWLFFDLKRGLEAEKLSAVVAEPTSTWLRERYQLGEANFADVHISGFGDAILRQFLNCGEAVRDFVKFMRGGYWQTHFADFFDLIYWYFAAEAKTRGI